MKYKLYLGVFAFILLPINLYANEINIDVDTASFTNSKIINGYPVFEQYPFMVYLETSYKNETSFCGGALISSLYVLTAAHCVVVPKSANDLLPTSSVSIYFGDNSIKAMKQDPQKKRTLARISTHLHFDNMKGYPNDIAILRLSRPINISAYANVLKTASGPKTAFDYELSQSVNLERGEGNNIASPNLTALGWGDTHEGFPDGLKKAYLITQRSDQCKRTHNNNASSKSFFCSDSSQTRFPSDTDFFIPKGAKDITFYVYQGKDLIYRKIFLDKDLDSKVNYSFSTYGTTFGAGVTENS